MKSVAKAEKLIKRMTADHLVDVVLLSPMQDLVHERYEAQGFSMSGKQHRHRAFQLATEEMSAAGTHDWHKNELNGMDSTRIENILSICAPDGKEFPLFQNSWNTRSADTMRFRLAEREVSQQKSALKCMSTSSEQIRLSSSVLLEEGCFVDCNEPGKNVDFKEQANGFLSLSSESAAHVERLRTGRDVYSDSEEATRVCQSELREAKKEGKCRTRVHKHKKGNSRHTSKEVVGLSHLHAKEDIKLVPEYVSMLQTQSISRGPLHLGNAQNPLTQNVLPTPATALPNVRMVKQEWVCCDRCEKWRLLPPGMRSAHLPEKWTCKLLFWLPGLNRCKVPETTTNQAVEPHYDAALSERLEKLDFPQVTPSVLQHHGRSQDLKRPTTEPGSKNRLVTGMERHKSMTASGPSILRSKVKNTQIGANRGLTEKGHQIDVKVSKERLVKREEEVTPKDNKKANYSRAHNELVQSQCSLGFILSEVTHLKQQAKHEHGSCPIEGKALDEYMKAAFKLLQVSALMEKGGLKSSKEELLVHAYIEAASLTKCRASANMNLIQLIGPGICQDADKLSFRHKQATSGEDIVISPDLNSTYEHLMQYVDLTIAATESLSKSQMLLSQIGATCSLGADVLVSLKRVLDFDLLNVGGLMQLVLDMMELLKD